MTSTMRSLLIVSGIVAALFLSGCSTTGCPTTSLTSSSTTGGGTTGGVSSGGTVCGSGTNGGGGGSAAAYLFYVDPTNLTVNTASLSSTGSFAVATGVTPAGAAGTSTGDMTVVNKQFVYIPFTDINGVQALSIDEASGTLTPVTGSPFILTGGTADKVIADPKGKFLFVGSEGIGAISVFSIGSSGALTQVNGSPFTSFNLVSADSMTVDGTGTYLYVGQVNPGVPVDVFKINSTSGALTEVGPYALGVAQLHADSSGKYLLGVQEPATDPFGAVDPHISVFSINAATGAPTAITNSPFTTTAPTFDFAIAPSGQSVYALEYNSGFAPLEGFSLSPTTGALGTSTVYSTLPAPTYCKFDESGGSLFCDNGAGFSVFTVNPTTGALTSTIQPLTGISYYSFAWAATD